MAFGDADASTPAFASVNTNWTSTGATSASFTPPADSLVRIAVLADTSAAANPGNETVTDSIAGATGWTFGGRRAKPDSGSQAGNVAVWTKYYAASPGAITVTVVGNATGANAGGFSIKVVAGCTGIEAFAEGSSTAAVVSLVVTTVSANTRCEVAATDWNVQANMTAGASQTAVLASSVGSGPDTRVYVGVQNAVTATPATAVTMSTASPSAGNANNFIGWALVPSVSATKSIDAAPTFTATISPTAATDKPVTATRSTTATISPTAATDKPVTATLTGTATITPAAAADKPVTASLTGTATIAPAAAVDRPAVATLAATATITVAMSVTSAGAQNIDAAPTFTATITASMSVVTPSNGMSGIAHGRTAAVAGAVTTTSGDVDAIMHGRTAVVVGAVTVHTDSIAGAVTN